MRLHENIDFTTLTWVKPELDETLRQARQALQAYVEEGEDPGQLKSCVTALHQVQGTLRMVELYGAAMVAEEMEQLAKALVEGRIGERETAYAALMRGIVQLPDYLERLQSGHRDIPIVLLPLLNELRETRGEKGLSEVVLFSPDLSRPLPPSAKGPDQPLPAAELKRRVDTLRNLFQSALLRWLKDDNSPGTIRDLTDVCEQLVPITSSEAARRLFWVAAGTLDALARHAFEATKPLKQALARIEREIKRLADGGDVAFRSDPPVELTKQLLYFVAHAPTDHGRIGEIREVFGLGDYLPSEAELAHARGSLSGRNRALLSTVAGAIKEDLLRVKDALDLHLRSPDAPAAELGSQVEALDRVADTLGMLGLGVPRRVVLDQRTAINDIVSGQRQSDESTLLDIAGALLYVEASLDDQVARLGEDDAAETAAGAEPAAALDLPGAEARKVLDVLVKEAIANFAQARQCFVAFVETHWDHAQLADVPRLMEEVAGALRILEMREAPEFLQAVRMFTEAELLRRQRVPNGQQMDRLADALASLEYYLEAVRDRRPNREQILDVARQSLESLGYWPLPTEDAEPKPTRVMEDLRPQPAPVPAAPVEVPQIQPAESPPIPDVVAASPAPAPEPEPLPIPEAVVTAPVTAPEPPPVLEAQAPAPEPAVAPPAPAAAVAPPAAVAATARGPAVPGFDGDSADIDDEIREVFLEEFQEEIANLDQLLPAWRNAPDNVELLRPIRRVFHTLKGSGRLVGAKTLGEFSWKIESMLNRVLDGSRPATPAVVALIERAFDVLPLLRAALGGETVHADLAGIEAVAERIAAGEEAIYQPPMPQEAATVAVAEPVVEAEAERLPETPPPVAEPPSAAPVPLVEGIDESAEEGVICAIDPVLFEILKPEVAGHLETVDAWLASCAAGPVPVTDPLLRSIHTMNGAFAMTEVAAMTEVTAPLEGFIKRSLAHGIQPEADGVQAVADAAAAIRAVVHALELGRPLPALTALAARITALRDALPEAKPAHLMPAAEEQAGPMLQPVVLDAPDTSAIPSFDADAERLEAERREAERREAERREAERREAERREAERLEAERLEAERLEAERLEAERLEAERLEAERLEAERRAAERLEAERLEAERREAERLEAERLEAERREAERREAERLEAERLEAERLEAERLEADRQSQQQELLSLDAFAEVAATPDAAEAVVEGELADPMGGFTLVEAVPEALDLAGADLPSEELAAMPVSEDAGLAPEAAPVEPEAEDAALAAMIAAYAAESPAGEAAEAVEAERLEAERLEAERLEAERLEAERLEAERREAERLEAERLEAERLEAERLEAERLEAERLEAERLEAERLEAERLEAERREAERLEAERREAERREAERREAERREAERLEAERLEAERLEAERLEAERLEAERLEAERLEAERLEAERLEAERREAERLEAERLEAERREAERRAPEMAPVAIEAMPSTASAVALPEDAEDPDAPLDTSDLDEDLLDIFLEESVDILDHSDGLLAKLRDDVADRELIVGLQRDLHTLKGGARMAGVFAVGELGHTMESLLEAVAEGRREIDAVGLQVLERAFDRLHRMVGRVGERKAISLPSHLINQLDALAKGLPLSVLAEPGAPAEAQQPAAAPVAVVPARTPAAAAPRAGFSAPIDAALEEEDATSVRAPQEQVRIRADLLDRLVNYAGEVAIYRARLEQQLGAFRANLAELGATTTRLREQLRKLDIETEAQIMARYQREGEAGDETFDPLELDRFTTQQQLSRSLAESAADLTSLQASLDDLTRQYETLLLQQSRVSSDLQEGLMRTRMLPFDALVPRLRRVLRQSAAEVGKQVQLKVDGASGEMDRNVLDRMTAPLEHMLRNSIAHGLETPEERRTAGKPEEGTVRIAVTREGSEVVLRISDDGRGLNKDAIRRRGIERGLISEQDELSDQALYALILESGFSTAETVSRLAGRGVGMDVVYSEVRQLGGSLTIDSTPGKGSLFTIRLPFTLAVTQAVFVRVGDTRYAVPIASVQGVGRISRDELEKQRASEHPQFVYAGEAYAIHDLGELIGHGPAKAQESLQMPLLLARSGDLRVAICIDQVLGSKEIVVKPVGPQVSSIPGIFGATVMGDGRVVVILDVAPLVRRQAAHIREHGRTVPETPATPVQRIPVVMVVDDSITMRKVTGRVLERHGMEVMTAKDGVDAIEKLAERVPDLMLLDIEMPRMDGYELAQNMKSDPRLRNVPIIMITSRTGEKHRQRAMDIGVNRYLGKPYQEPELMRNVYEMLGMEPVHG